MARVCQLTGTKAMTGNNVSFSQRKTKRKFQPNLVKKKFYLASEDKWIQLTITTSALRSVNKLGIEAMIKKAKAKGFYAG